MVAARLTASCPCSFKFTFASTLSVAFCEPIDQSGTGMKDASNSFSDSFSDINHSRWFLMSCTWLTALSFTLTHKPVKATRWQSIKKLFSCSPHPVTFFCARSCNGEFVQEAEASILLFSCHFFIPCIIIWAAWAEAPAIWTSRRWLIPRQNPNGLVGEHRTHKYASERRWAWKGTRWWRWASVQRQQA